MPNITTNHAITYTNSTDAVYALILSLGRAIALSTLARCLVKTSLQAAVSGKFCRARRKKHDLLSDVVQRWAYRGSKRHSVAVTDFFATGEQIVTVLIPRFQG